MNTLRTSLSSAASSALKGKAKQVTVPVVSFIPHSRSITSSLPSASTATTSSEPSTSTLPPNPTLIDSNSRALSLLKSQPSHYAIASITGRTYLVSKGDLVTVPRLKDVQVGDVLLLDKVHEIGSRDYTLRAQDTLNTRRISTSVDLPSSPSVTTGPSPSILPQPRRLYTRLPSSSSPSPLLPLSDTWSSRLIPNGLAHIGASLPPSTVKITAVVTENTKGALEKILKKKRRKGYKKTVQHKQPYTRIRIEDIQIQPST
ncbi:54S ribosomal protein L49, mitochondrial [Pseudozyma hubeiensis]|nr:54S ribosomal protein L49, mitochondrial [Pseudozyma hubeiensis]